MINITATDVQTTGLAWASADMILIIWVNYVFSNSGIKTLKNKTTLTIISKHDIVDYVFSISDVMTLKDKRALTIINTTATDVQITCVTRASGDIELTMRVGNVFSNSKIKTLRNNKSLTILNMTAADAQTTGLAWASADMISNIWIGCVFSDSGVISLWNDTKIYIICAGSQWYQLWCLVMENWVHKSNFSPGEHM